MNQMNMSKEFLKKDLIKSIIVCAAVTAIPLIFYVAFFIVAFNMAQSDFNYSEQYNEIDDHNKESLTLNDISIEYPSKWLRNYSAEDENMRVIYNGEARIVIAYSKMNIYFTTDSFANSMQEYYEDQDYTIIEELSDIEINGKTWKKLVYLLDGHETLQLFYAKDYDTYSFTFLCNDNGYDDYLDEVEKIYKTLTIDTTQDELDSEEAKKFLIGEWDWGTKGYLVIDEEYYYLYKDSTKSMDNVMYGTYKADNKIKTYGAGYTEGYYLLGTMEAFNVDGIPQTLGENAGIELAFIPNEDGSYTIRNINTYTSGIATKVQEKNYYNEL